MQEKTLLEEIQEDYQNPKPKELEPTKRKRKHTGKKLMFLFILTSIVIAEAITLLWCGWAWSQLNTLTIQSPLIVQRPLTWETKTKSDVFGTPAKDLEPKTKKEIIYGGGYGDILSKVTMLETQGGNASEGHHKDCEQLGRTNEFGYFKGGNRNFCFASYEESVKEVSEWFKLNLQEMPLPVALCYYNTGQLMSECTYSNNYYTL